MCLFILFVSRHFKPDPYQIKEKRANSISIDEHPSDPPYTIYWWRRTRPREKTQQFFMGFKVVPDRDRVYDAFSKVFAEVRVYANGPWFIVDLEQEYTWDEVRGVVAIALKGLVG